MSNFKAFCKDGTLQVVFSDGTQVITDCDGELWDFLIVNQDNEEIVKRRLLPKEEVEGMLIADRVKYSKILTLRGNSVYMLDISEQSIPSDFVEKILEAEESGDEAEIKKFKNFWTLVSLNPDSRVRNNLFWFIRKWNMKITEAGLIIAYRNADIKKESEYSTEQVKNIINSYYQVKYVEGKNPYEIYGVDGGINETSLGEIYDLIINEGANSPTYTDHHSHSTTIKLGQPVRMPREETDPVQENECSRGLHVAGTQWLKRNYFGDVGLMVLVNPANIVAIPYNSDYGKMRTCEYFPVALIDFDKNGDVIEPECPLYNDVAYLKQLTYEGEINNEDVDRYTIIETHLTREQTYNSILKKLETLNNN